MPLQTPPQPLGPGSPPGGRRGQLLLLAVLGVVLAAGLVLAFVRLTGGDGDKESLGEATAAAPAATTPANPDQAVLDAYRRASDAALEASRTADPRTPALLETRVGEALAESQQYLAGLRANGLVVRGSYETTDVRVVSVNGATATVTATGCDRSFKFDARTGEMRDSPRVVRFQEEATLVRVHDGWKVSKVVGEVTGECAA